MSIQTTQTLLDGIRKHGEATFPYECCGFLIGQVDGDHKSLTEIRSAENEKEENLERRFLITPQKYMEAERYAASIQQDVLGFYHSHPDHPAKPSQFDLDHAWPNQSYIIVSIMNGSADALTSWNLKEDRSAFDEEPIQTPET